MSEVCDLCLAISIPDDEADVCCECGRVFCSNCGDAPTMLCDACREVIFNRAVAERDKAHADLADMRTLVEKLTRERDAARARAEEAERIAIELADCLRLYMAAAKAVIDDDEKSDIRSSEMLTVVGRGGVKP